MLGYWRNDAATAEAMLPGGLLRTGDGGWIDDDGYVFLRDRIKDMIVSGGENIYPAEVEHVLIQLPRCRPGGGGRRRRRPAGASRRSPSWSGRTDERRSALTEASVIEWTRERIAQLQVPRRGDASSTSSLRTRAARC